MSPILGDFFSRVTLVGNILEAFARSYAHDCGILGVLWRMETVEELFVSSYFVLLR